MAIKPYYLVRASVILIIKNDKILGVSRRNDFSDMGLPGGKVNIGESFARGAQRELFEETGLRAYGLKPAYMQTTHNKMVVAFLAERIFGTIRSSDEGIVKWCTKEELIAGSFGAYNKALFEHLNLK